MPRRLWCVLLDRRAAVEVGRDHGWRTLVPRRRHRCLGQVPHARGPFVEERHTLANSEADRQAFAAAIVERGGGVVQRRKLLGGLLGGGMGIFGVVALFPLLRSLGPLPKDTLQHTDWRSGSYVVDQSGRRVEVGDLAVGSIETVFPRVPRTRTAARPWTRRC